MQATTFRGLRLDMSKAEIVQDIGSIAEENGVKHNPRYKFASVRPLWQCGLDSSPQDSDNGAPRVWLELLCDDKIWRAENFTTQNSTGYGKIHRVWEAPKSSDVPALTVNESVQLRRRWGYRNICQQLGVEWHDFRGGEDIVNPLVTKYADCFPNPNKLDKLVPPEEWAAFANLLPRSAIARVLHADD